MSIESNYRYPSDLDASLPAAGDPKSEGDDHIRGLKTQQKTTWPNVAGAVTASHSELNLVDGSIAGTQVAGKAVVADSNVNIGATKVTALHIGASGSETQVTASAAELNHTDGVTSPIQTQLDAKAPIASPTFTGTPLAPTAAAGTNNTQIATTAYADNAVAAAGISGGLPSQTGNAGKALITNGSSVSWGIPTSGSSITSAVAIANTETVVHSYTCAANELATGTTFIFRVSCSQSGTNAATPTWRIRVGTTTLTGNVATSVSGASGSAAANTWIEATVTCISAGAGGTIKGSMLSTKAAAVNAAVDSATSTVAVDTTASGVKIEFTAISGNAGVTYTFNTATVTKVVA